MLEQAFSWLYSQSSEMPILMNQTLTLDDIRRLISDAEQQKMLKLRTFYAVKLHPSSLPDVIISAKDDLERAEQFSKFLSVCEKYLQKSQPLTPYEIIFQLLKDNVSLDSKMIPFFKAWLAQDKQTAMRTYDIWCDQLLQKVNTDSPEARRLIAIGKLVVDEQLVSIKSVLEFQENPLGISRQLAHLSAHPLRFAAFIRLLVENKVPIVDLMNTGLLQQYLGYYFDLLDSDKYEIVLSPVSFLYQLFEQFESLKPLVTAAKQVACDVPGYHKYNLIGVQTKESLKEAKICTELPLFTRTLNNVKRMLDVFGQNAIIDSVHTLYHGSTDEFDQSFVAFFKESPLLITPPFIRHISEYTSDFKKWANLLEDRHFEQCIVNRELSIIYFIPYKQQWIERIDLPFLQAFFQIIQAQQKPGSEIETLKLLRNLYEIASTKNTLFGAAIYESMVDLVINYRYLIEDKLVFKQLKLAPHKGKCIQQRADNISQRLNSLINVFLNNAMTKTTFSHLKSAWNDLSNQIEVLQCLSTKKLDFPQTESNFIIYLFRSIVQTNVTNLMPYLEFFNLTDVTIEQSHETLFQLLTEIDNEVLRLKIIELLGLTREAFLTHMRPHLFNAIVAGNKGLLDWFLEKVELDDRLLHQAIISKQWQIIKHWFMSYDLPEFSQDIRDQLIQELALSGNTNLLRQVARDFGFVFSEAGISSAFINAALSDNYKALYILYQLKPLPMALKSAFAHAIDKNCTHALDFFEGIKKHKPQLVNEVIRAFNTAVKNNNKSLIARLFRFSKNAPPRPVIQKAIEAAMNNEAGLLTRKQKKSLHAVQSASLSPKGASAKDIDTIREPDQIKMSDFLKTLSKGEQAQINRSATTRQRELRSSRSYGSTDSLAGYIFGSPIGMHPNMRAVASASSGAALAEEGTFPVNTQFL